MGSGGIAPALGGLRALQEESLGDPDVCVAVIDGPVDLSHPCFAGANLRRITTLVQDPAGRGPMSVHGTHVTSMIFGQPGSSVSGVAPKCRGLILPVFRDIQEGHLPQLDLARAIEQAVQEGAHIINVSGGERSPNGQADTTLQRALRLCAESNVLVVAATGNDGCPCLQVPAALASVLAVGALGKNGEPYEMSNWGDAYRVNGVLAPGEGITGAVPGGGTIALTGSSFATPLVSGVAALLLSIQRRIEGRIDPRAVADAILHTAARCDPPDAAECHRYLAGIINISGAHASISKGETTVADMNSGVRAASVDIPSASDGPPGAAADTNAPVIAAGDVTSVAPPAASGPAVSESPVTALNASAAPPEGANPGAVPAAGAASGVAPAAGPAPGVAPAAGVAVSVAPSGDCNCKSPGTTSYIYAIGQVRFDFESEANRDAFRQLMPEVVRDDLDPPVRVQPNPYDVFQLVDYLDQRPSESTKLVWTLNLDLTPIYAIEAELAYPEEVYSALREALRNGALPSDDENYVSRASIPGVLTGRTVQLFSGQTVPVVVAQARGLYVWREAALINQVIEALRPTHPDMDENYVRQLTRIFLDKVYYECRNLGVTPPDRALNFAATNAYQVGSAIARGITSGQLVPGSEGELFTLDSIDVTKSPYCRMDSDCWDVRIKFFSPENDRRAKSLYQFTIDVSREMPVSLAPEHQFLTT
jgi:cyanobactin maturation PatA/PatG family protease